MLASPLTSDVVPGIYALQNDRHSGIAGIGFAIAAGWNRSPRAEPGSTKRNGGGDHWVRRQRTISDPHDHGQIAVVFVAQAMVVMGYLIVYHTMKTNSFAASIIRVEQGQSVIDVGPYARVRHPLYSGMAIAELATPLALGSYIAVPIFGLLVPLLIYRLIHEERTLCGDLAGYSEYCGRTKFRLIPGVW